MFSPGIWPETFSIISTLLDASKLTLSDLSISFHSYPSSTNPICCTIVRITDPNAGCCKTNGSNDMALIVPAAVNKIWPAVCAFSGTNDSWYCILPFRISFCFKDGSCIIECFKKH
eukprot:NODE_19_length_39463_cov_0.396073.p25 type:complete len:116 gc:universal NODE_19_length_39463_cov_0.396073:30411-30758(+)